MGDTQFDDAGYEQLRFEQDLIAQLAGSPIEEVIGLVHSDGVGVFDNRARELWMLVFYLTAWRVGEGAVCKDDSMVVRREVSTQELDRLRTEIRENTVIRMLARVCRDGTYGSHQAWLEKVVEQNACDSELQKFLVELQERVIYIDEFFGEFVLDRRLDGYVAGAKWNGTDVELVLSFQDPSDLEGSVVVARELWSDSRSWDKRVRDCIVEELLSVKNSGWLQEGESELSREDFESRMRLNFIFAEPDRSFEFSYGDDDMFWGHGIVARGSLDQGIESASIEG